MTSLAQTLQSALDANAGLLPVGAPDVPTGSTVLTVGTGEQFSTIGAAVAAAHDGTVILVDAGTYTNDFATITSKITIEGAGGMVSLVATAPPPNLKGIFTVDNDVTIKNLSFSGSSIPDSDGGNGAGIRYEGGRMVLVNDSFSDNEDGILASPVLPQLTVNTIAIDHSVFSANGSGSGYTHNLYVGAVDSLTATNSIFEQAVVGHEFKSRALVNDIEGNIFRDGPTATASYDIDLPNGGADLIQGNIVEKGPNAENNAMVHFGGEGIPYAGSSLTITGNSFVNDKGAATLLLLNQTAISATVTGNALTALAGSQIAQGPATITSNTDGNGTALPDMSLTGVLPGSTTVYTDNNPHTIVLNKSDTAVQGAGGLLTVTAIAGHVVAIGGTGGLVFAEGPSSGGNSITTKAGAADKITVVGQDVIDSEGNDTIVGGAGNITALVGGNAVIDDGTGSDSWSVKGSTHLIGHGGNPVVALASTGTLNVTGTLGYLAVQDNGGALAIDVMQGGSEVSGTLTGAAADVHVYSSTLIVATAGGSQGSTIRLGRGAAQVTSVGADTIWAGAGAANIIVSGRAVVHAGSGQLTLFGRGDQLGATFYGNGGHYVIDGDSGNITYVGGAAASTVESRLSNDFFVGGAGRLTINGGSRETITGGTGGITYTATDGGGANMITTMAGSHNTLTLAGADVVTSRGSDTIFGGAGNQTLSIYGNTGITGSTGASTIAFYGHDFLIGRGQDTCVVNPGAAVTIGAGTLTSVTETAANIIFGVSSGPYASRLSVWGGAATVLGGTTLGTAVSTTVGHRTTIELTSGTASATLNGADTVTTGAGTFKVDINAAHAQVNAGAGAVTIHDNDTVALDAQTVHAGSGTLTYSQGNGALTFLGGSGAATLDGGWGSLSVTGGAGDLAISGGSAGMRFVAGSGAATVALTSAGGDLTFGTGATAVQEAGYGAGSIFRFASGSGGGTDVIGGFRGGVDKLVLTGVAVRSQTTTGGSTLLVLTDNTHVQLIS